MTQAEPRTVKKVREWSFETVEWRCPICDRVTKHKERDGWYLVIRCSTQYRDGEDHLGYTCSLVCLAALLTNHADEVKAEAEAAREALTHA